MVLGDAHGGRGGPPGWMGRVFEWASHCGARYILQLGDYGVWPGKDGREFLELSSRLSTSYGIPIYFVEGNHDDYTYLGARKDNLEPDGSVAIRDGVRWLPRGTRWTWGGIRFGALGGAVTVYKHLSDIEPGKNWWPEESISQDDVDKLGDDQLDILVTHDMPILSSHIRMAWDIPAWVSADIDDTRRMLAQAVQRTRPSLILHGHLHVRGSGKYRYHVQTEDGSSKPALARIEGFAYNGSTNPGDAWGILYLPAKQIVNGSDLV